MSVSNQMMKGLLDGAILGLIAKGETYGYEILEKLNENQFPEVSDGSIYPVLPDCKKGYVQQPRANRITVDRRSVLYDFWRKLERFKEKWSYLNSGMNNLFGR